MAAIAVAVPAGMSGGAFAQSWQPTRVAPTAQARQLETAPRATAIAAAPADTEQLGSGVALRWKTTSPRTADGARVSEATAQNAFHATSPAYAEATSVLPTASVAFEQSATQTRQRVDMESRSHNNNPLRSTGRVQQAAYQQQPNDVYQDPFGDSPPPILPDQLPRDLPQLPGNENVQPPTGNLPNYDDPLAAPEMAPDPSALQLKPPNPFDRNNNGRQNANPQQGDGPELIDPSPADEPADEEEELDELATQQSSRASCNAHRERLRNAPLSKIDLDVSPNYGEGLSSIKADMEQKRLDFAAGSEVREWSNYRGALIATGRLIDLRDDRVVLDVNGAERTILFRDLSDVDVAYVGKSWNIPQQCGIGYEQFIGRNFIPSTVQWTASGACHKPLYFEQVQLERYGHEAGPVLQPLVSTVHFFGNIAVLPYKMGIHPPGECQYSLGYFRPGNCAPYMMQPIPWSLRGALMQAGAVTGGAALIP